MPATTACLRPVASLRRALDRPARLWVAHAALSRPQLSAAPFLRRRTASAARVWGKEGAFTGYAPRTSSTAAMAAGGQPAPPSPGPPPATPDKPPPPPSGGAKSEAEAAAAAGATVGPPVSLEGVVVRRQTVGRCLTFMDVAEGGPGGEVAYLKVLVKVPKRVRAGARVHVAGHFVSDDPRFTGSDVPGVKYLIVTEADRPGGDGAAPLETFGGLSILEAAPPVRVTRVRSPNGEGSAAPTPAGGGLVKMTAICRTFLGTGACQDPMCVRRHDPSEAELERATRAYKNRNKRSKLAIEANIDPDDPHADASKAQKHLSDRLFARWIIATFGEEKLVKGGVADIAGGRGELSYELHVENGIPCTLIDTRAIALTSRQWSRFSNLRRRGCGLQKGDPKWERWRRAEQWAIAADMEQSWVDGAGGVPLVPERTEGADGGGWGSGARVPEEMREAMVSAREMTSTAEEDGVAEFKHATGEFWGVGSDTGKAAAAALEMGRPFAVVPCCVFPSLFPDRVHPDGGDVTTYERFVEYLCAKDPGVKVGYLPFKGRNKVVYKE